MTILFLHGWNSAPGGVKPTYLKEHGCTVINPQLPDDDFDAAVRIAQAEFDQHQPKVVVGSSRGGAVAMHLKCDAAKLVLLCPAWKRFGTARTAKYGTTILHSRGDEVIPFADSEELIRNSRLLPASLIEVGTDHRLADPEPLATMWRACQETLPVEKMDLACCGRTRVYRLKDLPKVDGIEFDLFRCGGCGQAWLASWCPASAQGVRESISDSDAEKMMSLVSQELREYMEQWT
jgi:pimeloyl-ACP methyl ester carboxylesterase